MRVSTLLSQGTSAFHLEMRRRWAGHAAEMPKEMNLPVLSPHKRRDCFPIPTKSNMRKRLRFGCKNEMKTIALHLHGLTGQDVKEVERNAVKGVCCKKGQGVAGGLHCDAHRANVLMILAQEVVTLLKYVQGFLFLG